MKRISIIASICFALDLLIKLWASVYLKGQTLHLWKLAELRIVHNGGIALGLCADDRVVSMLLPLAVIACAVLLLRRYCLTNYTSTCYGLILGGFAGNYVQRITLGYVVDMIYFPWLPFFVCNVADIAICIGVGMLMISLLFRGRDWQIKSKGDRLL